MTIISYASVDILHFDESMPEACIALYGKPSIVRTNREGVEEYEYGTFIIRFDPATKKLRECTLLPKTVASIGNLNVTWDDQFLKTACELDGTPLDVYGFIVLPTLGIAVTGIHDHDYSQMAITAFSKNDLNEWVSDGIPFDVASY